MRANGNSEPFARSAWPWWIYLSIQIALLPALIFVDGHVWRAIFGICASWNGANVGIGIYKANRGIE